MNANIDLKKSYLLVINGEIKIYRAALGKMLQQSTCDINMPMTETCKKTEELLSFSSRTDHFHPKVTSSTLHLTPTPQITN